MAPCASCGEELVPGSMFCDACGAPVGSVKAGRKLRQKSFTDIKDAKSGLLAPSERIRSRRFEYLIEEAIARSGFGATFRAMRLKDEKQVLIKQMIEQSGYDAYRKQLFAAFKREAKFLKKIKHPAFPRGFEYFERNGSFFLVMEFINGKELAKALTEYRSEKGDIPDGLVVFLGIEIAEALQIIHDADYVYRDLKPQNVMLDGISGRVKMIDFGTLYHLSDKDPLIFESEGYTPPEFLDSKIAFRASGDIYSLGAMLYEMITGHTPGPSDDVLIKDTKRDPRLLAIVAKCLQKDPAQRYARVRAVQAELAKLTKKGWIPFLRKNVIQPVELSVLPKTLYPPQCTFCEFCGWADAESQAGYCPSCRVPLKVGRLSWKIDKTSEREFFLYSDETLLGKSAESHVSFKDLEAAKNLQGLHLRIFRKKGTLWAECVDKNQDNTKINRRKIIGPVELIEGDALDLNGLALHFTLKDAC